MAPLDRLSDGPKQLTDEEIQRLLDDAAPDAVTQYQAYGLGWRGGKRVWLQASALFPTLEACVEELELRWTPSRRRKVPFRIVEVTTTRTPVLQTGIRTERMSPIPAQPSTPKTPMKTLVTSDGGTTLHDNAQPKGETEKKSSSATDPSTPT